MPARVPNRRVSARVPPGPCRITLAKPPTLLEKLFGLRPPELTLAAVDVSATGARFVTRDRLMPGRRVKVGVHVPLLQDRFELSAVVVWCMPARGGERGHDVGVRFVDLDAAQERRMEFFRRFLDCPETRQRETVRRRAVPSEGLMLPR